MAPGRSVVRVGARGGLTTEPEDIDLFHPVGLFKKGCVTVSPPGIYQDISTPISWIGANGIFHISHFNIRIRHDRVA